MNKSHKINIEIEMKKSRVNQWQTPIKYRLGK